MTPEEIAAKERELEERARVLDAREASLTQQLADAPTTTVSPPAADLNLNTTIDTIPPTTTNSSNPNTYATSIKLHVPITLSLDDGNYTSWRELFLVALGRYGLTAHVIGESTPSDTPCGQSVQPSTGGPRPPPPPPSSSGGAMSSEGAGRGNGQIAATFYRGGRDGGRGGRGRTRSDSPWQFNPWTGAPTRAYLQQQQSAPWHAHTFSSSSRPPGSLLRHGRLGHGQHRHLAFSDHDLATLRPRPTLHTATLPPAPLLRRRHHTTSRHWTRPSSTP
ncbi:hypothetical protein QYE76_013960 [Lolium multiflorum]|uniref:Uncharacterized protein n=1 Tax=Lolium multiflorum TaxID=4521 RepID=A0AAD8X522_LOLMU|nr:hypothetical protein QYE76_013960 [Lolium multiflorum]